MKIIFLDIDGVLNLVPQGRDEYGAIFHTHFVTNLEKIISETGADIVISSTWRMGNGLDGMQKMWQKRGLPGTVIGVTPIMNTIRGEEIAEYLRENPVDNYVILDDDSDMLFEQKRNFVQCAGNYHHSDYIDAGYGLTKECTEMAIKILNS